MKVALLRCCTTPIFLPQYETSTNAVLERLGVTIVGDSEFNCCGYPLRNFNRKAYVLASARNLALAEKRSLNLLTVCNCCYGSLKQAEHIMKEDGALREHTMKSLDREGLDYDGRITAKHLLQLLYDDIGIGRIKQELRRSFRGLKIATHYGCHLLRPSEIAQFDNPFTPVKFDQLVEATGAESIPWPHKLDCCGSPMWGVNDELSMSLTGKKLRAPRQPAPTAFVSPVHTASSSSTGFRNPFFRPSAWTNSCHPFSTRNCSGSAWVSIKKPWGLI